MTSSHSNFLRSSQGLHRHILLAAFLLLIVLVSGRNISAQTSQSPPSVSLPQTTLPTGTESTGSTSDLDENSRSSERPRTTLSAAQIITILQDRPQVVVELKTLLAEAQQPPVQPDSISDEMLYSQIASSKELRDNITVFLRARGYVSDDDFQRAPMDTSDRASQAVFSAVHAISDAALRSQFGKPTCPLRGRQRDAR